MLVAVMPSAHTPGSAARASHRGGLAARNVQPLTWATQSACNHAAASLVGSDVLGQLVMATTFVVIVSTVCARRISEFIVRQAAQKLHTLRRDQGIALAVQMITAGLMGGDGVAYLRNR